MAFRQHKILQEGAPAPEIDGLPPERPLLVVFFKITCPVCQLTLPFLNRLHRTGSLPVVGISQNEPDDTSEFNEEFGIEFPVVFDREGDNFLASNAYGINSVPSMFLLEAGGKIGRVIEGWSKREMSRLGVLRQEDHVPEWKAG
jgi:peroxiredoxin